MMHHYFHEVRTSLTYKWMDHQIHTKHQDGACTPTYTYILQTIITFVFSCTEHYQLTFSEKPSPWYRVPNRGTRMYLNLDSSYCSKQIKLAPGQFEINNGL